MAKIAEVNYKEFPAKAKKMRSTATSINSEIVASYSKINAMKSSWYGERYNSLATTCNDIVPDLDKMMKLIVTTIPFTLEQVANNYSKADRGSKITTEEQMPPKKVPEISKSNDTKMRFLTAEVTSVKDAVGTAFDKALNLLDEFEKTFKSLNWKSEAADSYAREFTRLKGKISVAFEKIKKSFVKLMKEASDAIQGAETSNTI